MTESEYLRVAAVLIKALYDFLSSVDPESWKKVSVNFEKTFRAYVKNSIHRYSSTKTLLHRDKPISIDKIFVSPELRYENNRITAEPVSTLVQLSRKAVVVGTAGSGKSMLFKRFFLSLIASRNYGIPVLVELRLMNNSGLGLLAFVAAEFHKSGLKISEDLVTQCVSAGRISLLLDGFDELNQPERERVQAEVNDIAGRYPDAVVFLSSRPDETFNAWQQFTTFMLHPFDKDRVHQLVDKLEFEKSVKAKFKKDLDEELYKSHKDFLSNPLLVTIMLLTYAEYAGIPEKMTIFYEQAFDALLYRHDANKFYKRQFQCPLAIDDFRRVLECFAISTYLKREITFSASALQKHVNEAKRLSGANFTQQAFIQDMLRSVCFLVSDGKDTTFTHRSFQEYFAARYLDRMDAKNRRIVLRRIAEWADRDNVVDLLFDINRRTVESDLFLPVLAEVCAFWESQKHLEHAPSLVAERWFSAFDIQGIPDNSGKRIRANVYVSESSTEFKTIRKARELYRKMYPEIKQMLSDAELVKASHSFLESQGKNLVQIQLASVASNPDALDALSQSGIRAYQKKWIDVCVWLRDKIVEDQRTADDQVTALLET